MAMAVGVTAAPVLSRRNDNDDVPFPSPSFHSNRQMVGRRRREEEDFDSWKSIANSERAMKATKRSREQLWHHFFAAPWQWWDNRLSKKNSKQPDFRHKRTMEALWIDSPQDPFWVRERIATLDSPGHMRQRKPYSNGVEAETVKKFCMEGRLKDALHLVECMMQQSPIEEVPNGVYISLLKECAKRKMLTEGKWVHALMDQSKCGSNIFLANNLINMYSKCNSLLDACTVFNAIPQHNVFSWTAIISAYAYNGKCEEAINLYKEMQKTGIPPDKVVFLVILKACARTAALETGKHIHSLILEKGFHLDISIQTALVDMYAKCGCLHDAHELFNNMTERNVVSWTAMIAGYVQNGLDKEALDLYKKMEEKGMQANKITFTCVLKACANIGAGEHGKQIHSRIVRRGCHLDMILQSTLVDMYAKCGCLDDARELFNSMSVQDVVSWNTMIAGYVQNGRGTEAIALYQQMKQEGMEPDEVTYVCVLNACAGVRLLELGKQVHSLILEKGFHLDIIIQSTLVDMYAKCGCLDNACELFNNMNERDVVSWTAMIAGYVQHGLDKEALVLYEKMKQDGIQANIVTFVCVLKACASIGALERGKELHTLIVQKGFHLDMVIRSTLVDMYAKCGCLDNASELFQNMSERSVVSWNALIAGYAQSGLGTEAIALFQQMKQEGIQPNGITYICILSACSHSGMVEEGFCVFDFMCKYSDIIPTLEHYACMVDLLCRAGWLAEAKDLILKMPIQADSVVWMSLLGAARHAGNAEIGQGAFDLIVKLDPENAAPYLLLIDIYERVGQMVKVAEITKEMMKKGLEKIPRCS